MLDDLHRPLGRDIPRKTPAARRLGLARAMPLCLALAVAGGSAATALMQPELRDADAIAELAATSAAREAALAAAPAEPNLDARASVPSTVRRSRAADDEAAPVRDPSLPTITYPPGVDGLAGQLVSIDDPGSLRQSKAMAHLPDDALIETGDAGPLPIRGPDGRRPFDVYSVAPATEFGTRIAIVVGGIGISQTGTQAALEALPQAVTLAFAPGGNSLDRWMKQARRGGHEILLQLPMEPVGYPQVSPGPNTIEAAAVAAGDFEALDASLGTLTNYVGVVNYMGARLTAEPAAMRGVIGELGRRGLLYLDDASSSRSLAKEVALDAGVVFAASDVLIDATQDPAAIAKQLGTLERIARAEGSAIGTASAFDMSVEAIAAWASEAKTRGIEIVPVSALANDPERR